MSILEALLLGLIQGITEFLPVSSSGHLAVLEHLWKLPAESRLPLTTMLHGATALSVIFYFAPLLAKLIRGLWVRDAARRSGSWRMAAFILLASIPAGLIGVTFSDIIDRAFTNPLLVGLMLLVTGGVLFGTRYSQPQGRSGWLRALLVGCGQAIAILPGISRSGATIATGLYLGMERKEAFEFSFLLAIPAVTGAFFLEARKVDLAVINPTALAVGMVAAFVSGLAALYALARFVTGRKLHWFAFYCWLAGLATILFVR
ncbi:undecaprenyl-diphosphate phosphatase [candidate division WOR-3 bacterium]|uniref:Undecaprenyl-diphosphatase n=1 Tax=candidate division WOR-3 bacterium TaxID=2052148 RepID=A0A938BU86_UNCW3|nr:undecaprenyl-diphosphate phosphatase [candidate division WOR-3 bacterium]